MLASFFWGRETWLRALPPNGGSVRTPDIAPILANVRSRWKRSFSPETAFWQRWMTA